MKIVFKIKSSTHSSFVVDAYTTHALSPWFARAECPCEDFIALDVPTEPAYDSLAFECFCTITNEEGRQTKTPCGAVFLVASDFKQSKMQYVARAMLKNEDGSAGAGQLVVIAPTPPSATELYPCSKNVVTTTEKIVERSKKWYKTRKPIDPDLANVHVPRLPSFWCRLPGFFFSVQTPVEHETEQFFVNVLRASMRRRNLQQSDVLSDARLMDIVTAEALAALPNSNVYNADVDVDLANENKLTNIDRFSNDERIFKCGDCEDMAAEVRLLAYSLRKGNWNTEIVRAAQRSVRRYVVGETFGAVALPPDPANDPYKAGRFFAHAFVLFLPVHFVAEALARGGDTARLVDAAVDVDPQARTLTQDGISLFDADALHPTHPLIAYKPGVGDERVRRVEPIGLRYYMFPCSIMINEGTVVSTKEGTPIYELGFVTTTNNAYGARYVDILNQSRDVGMVPTCELTRQEHQVALRCSKWFHPVVPFNTTGGAPDLAGTVETWLRATRFTEGTDFEYTFFLQGDDALDETYMLHLRDKLKNRRVMYTCDWLAQGEFTVQVFVAPA